MSRYLLAAVIVLVAVTAVGILRWMQRWIDTSVPMDR